MSGRIRGTVILGCTLHTGPLDLAAVLARLRDQHPGVIVQLRQSLAGSAGNLQAVRDGSMDIALTASPADSAAGRSPRGVILAPLVSEPLVFICSSRPAGASAPPSTASWAPTHRPSRSPTTP